MGVTSCLRVISVLFIELKKKEGCPTHPPPSFLDVLRGAREVFKE
jgi:hypothetical protein